MITVSVVSHYHGKFLFKLISNLLEFSQIKKIILTINVNEEFNIPTSPKIYIVRNKFPKGFGENHNNAFKFCKTNFFCILNPDIYFCNNPFKGLISAIKKKNVAIIAPIINDTKGRIDDSARKFPTIFSLFLRFIIPKFGAYDLRNEDIYFYPDWVAGMFMLFRSKDFLLLNGFDINFFMYCEDIDICMRAKNLSMRVMLYQNEIVIHDARRSSHKNIIYMFWHIKSLLRILLKN
jgi:N-acetylglucosaminyl-diphospho-decaprenol L-rhamnosyltransferase